MDKIIWVFLLLSIIVMYVVTYSVGQVLKRIDKLEKTLLENKSKDN